MSDTAPLTTLLAPLGATVIAAALASGLTYLGVRRSTGVTAVVSREDRESREMEAREDRINERVDAYLENQNKQLADMRAENLLMAQRLDTLWVKLGEAQDDILVCRRQREDLVAEAIVTARKVAELTTSNATLQARVTQLEAGTT